MRYAGMPNWLMWIQTPHGLLAGLFVRDAAGLQPRTAFELPPLVPAVELRADLAPLAVAEASEEWARWWERELGREDAQRRGFCAPDARCGDGPALVALLDACHDEAMRWSSDRKGEESEATAEAMRREDPGPEGALVSAVEREIGRKARPFELEVTVLPVAGKGAWRVAPGHVVVSRALRADTAAYGEWLTQVIRELA